MTSTEGGHFRHLVQMWAGMDNPQEVCLPTYGLSMDQAVEVLRIPSPRFIKMDVDGIATIFCEGQPRSKGIQGILVEINDDFAEQAEVSKKLLEEAGLTLLEKRHSEMFEDESKSF